MSETTKQLATFQKTGMSHTFLSVHAGKSILEETKEFSKRIWEDKENAKDYRYGLAGNISHEYSIPDEECVKLKDFIFKRVVPAFWTNNDAIGCLRPYLNMRSNYVLDEFEMGATWINFMGKHEFNPPHNHTGLISWVYYVTVPYLLEDERKLRHTEKTNCPSVADFVFHYMHGNEFCAHSLNIDKRSEGLLVMFPAYLNHAVYPFYTSDELRVSISGNIVLKEHNHV